jgi:demethylmenaquinone methyltransferase/2-methoxy-6-polyprenyl-1,4-benzoquinol methylase
MHYKVDFIRVRYNRLAPLYPLFDLVFWLPRNISAKAIKRLDLKSGDKVLEVGCGTGRNLSRLVEAVGPTGEVFGVDCSDGMLAKARELCARHQWQNVKLSQQDAAEMVVPAPVDGVLFGLSYTVIPEPLTALAQAWKYLRYERHIVIMDGTLARGLVGRLSRPVITFLSEATVLGHLDRQPWKDLKSFTPQVEVEEVNFGTYYICRGTKLSSLDS